ncbi:MAG: bL28 family ribosomal protein, partial [Acetobacterales bacterium]
NKTRRRFLPNLQHYTLQSELLGRSVKLRLSAHGLRSVEHAGGLDAWLLKTKNERLSPEAMKVKRQIRKARDTAETAAAAAA